MNFLHSLAMHMIHNTRVTLLSTIMNNLAVALIVAGFVAPAASGQLEGARRLVVAVAWVGDGATLHGLAQAVLGRLKP